MYEKRCMYIYKFFCITVTYNNTAHVMHGVGLICGGDEIVCITERRSSCQMLQLTIKLLLVIALYLTNYQQ